jgi:ribose 5-phosphate isomerase B
MKLYIASDHGGYLLKRDIIDKINSLHFIALGCDTNKSTDYPDYAHKLCSEISGDDREY